MNQEVQTYEQGGLPTPAQYGNFAALQQYFGSGDVQKRVAFRLDGDKDRAKKVLANLYEVVETAQDPGALLECDPRSLITTCIAANQVGLTIDKRQHAWVVPFWNDKKKVKEAQMQIGWKGYVHRLTSKLDNCVVHVGLVHKGDVFTVESSGSLETYSHKPADPFASSDTDCVGAYCYVSWTTGNGEAHSIVGRMGAADIQKIRSSAKTDMIWKKWWSEQAKKSVIKRTCKVQFSSITDDLDTIDNEQYDMKEPEEAKPVSKPSDIDAAMEEEDAAAAAEQDSSPDESANITDVDCQPNY